jgi:hypothetical protein
LRPFSGSTSSTIGIKDPDWSTPSVGDEASSPPCSMNLNPSI